MCTMRGDKGMCCEQRSCGLQLQHCKDLQGIPAAGHPVAVFVTAAGKNNPFLVSQIYRPGKTKKPSCVVCCVACIHTSFLFKPC